MNNTIPRIVRVAHRHLHARFQTTQPLAVLDPSKAIVLPPAPNTYTEDAKTRNSSYVLSETTLTARARIGEVESPCNPL